MKILMMPDPVYDYLKHVVSSYAAAGIAPEEGLAIYQLHQSISGVRTMDDTQVAKVTTGEIAGVPVATVAVEEKAIVTKDDKPYIPERYTRDEDRGPGNGLYDRPA